MNSKKFSVLALLAVMLCAPIAFQLPGNAISVAAQEDTDTLIVGTGNGPVDLDCVFAWDSASSNVYDQVIEGLYQYDLTDPSLAIEPILASADGTWSNNDKTYTVPLRTGVTFHDGTPFNASAAKWNFDRLAFFMNITGTLPEGTAVVQTSSLYQFGDGTPIINNTVANDAGNTITFNLNRPFAAFQALLCFGSSFIQSPHSTPAEEYVVTTTGDIVGTGPYVYDSYDPDVEVLFHAYDDYWNTANAANIENLVYKIIGDGPSLNQALLDGELHALIDPLTEYLWQFYQDENIIVKNPGDNIRSAYLGMNCKSIQKEIRQAISYAIDYDYVIDEIYNGYATRMESPVPKGVLMSDYSSDEATLDLTTAREKMQDAGYGTDLDLDDDAAWEASTFLTYNYSYNTDNQIRADLLPVLQNNLGKIGIEVVGAGMIWGDVIYRLYEIGGMTRDMLELFWIGWIPDYNDPSNWLDPLLSTNGGSNGAQFSSATVDAKLAEAMEETDQTARAALYSEVQKILVEDEMPWVYGVVTQNWDAFRGVRNFPSNPMGKYYFAPVEWGDYAEEDTPIDPNATTEEPGIPGYSVAIVGIVSLGAAALVLRSMKRRK